MTMPSRRNSTTRRRNPIDGSLLRVLQDDGVVSNGSSRFDCSEPCINSRVIILTLDFHGYRSYLARLVQRDVLIHTSEFSQVDLLKNVDAQDLSGDNPRKPPGLVFKRLDFAISLTSRPANFAFELLNVAGLMPCSRHTSFVARLASCSLSIVTICASLYWVYFMEF